MGDTRTSSKQWSTSVERAIATELSIGGGLFFSSGVKVTSSVKVAAAHANMASQSFARTMSVFRRETDISKTIVKFDRPGTIWQWEYEVKDNCGTSTVFTRHMAITNNGAEPPCCPLGMSKDPANQRGACVKPEYCICSPSKCKALAATTTTTVPTTSTTLAPTPAPTTGTTPAPSPRFRPEEDTVSGAQHDSFVLTSFLILFFGSTMTV